MPRSKPTDSVEPDRESPGNTAATHWVMPMRMASTVWIFFRPLLVTMLSLIHILSIDNVRPGFIQNSDHTQGIDGMRIHFVHGFVLLEHIFDHADLFLFQLLVHGGKAGEILFPKLIDAEAAAGGLRFDHDHLSVCHEIRKLLLGSVAKVQPLAADILGELGVKLAFVVEEMIVVTVIQDPYQVLSLIHILESPPRALMSFRDFKAALVNTTSLAP